jgi:hypothetical protein
MGKSLPLNDFGTSTVVSENCQQISVHDVLQQYQEQWKRQLAQTELQVMDQPVRFTTSKLGHGGTRLWFSCPQCKRRCGTLYEHPVSAEIGCRVCLGVRYSKSRYKGMIEENIRPEP